MKLILTTDQLMGLIVHIQSVSKSRLEHAVEKVLSALDEKSVTAFAEAVSNPELKEEVDKLYPIIETAGELIDIIDKL